MKTYATPLFKAKIRRAICADRSYIHYFHMDDGSCYVIPPKLYWVMRLIGWPRFEIVQPGWV